MTSIATRDSTGGKVDPFVLSYEGFDPDAEGLREVLASTGNGRFCARGAAEWENADGTHYPGTYAHGIYNRETTILGGVPVLNEDLVNLPNSLVLKLRIGREEQLDPAGFRSARRTAPVVPRHNVVGRSALRE